MKKGFTLVELLGVIVILSILMLVIFPNVVGVIKGKSEEKYTKIDDIVLNAADILIKENIDKFSNSDGTSYCILISELVSEGYINKSIIDKNKKYKDEKGIYVTYVNNVLNKELVNKEDCIKNAG